MLNLLVRKWWVVLIQGILLLLLSFFIFRNPVTVLSSVSIWMALLILISGIISLVTSFVGDKSEHKGLAILWSLATIIFGFLLLTNMLVTMKAITILFGLWMLAGGVRFTAAGWTIKSVSPLGWLVIIIGILSAIAAIMVMTNLGTGAVGITVLLGTQVFIAAVALMILAFVKKSVGSALKGKIKQMQSK